MSLMRHIVYDCEAPSSNSKVQKMLKEFCLNMTLTTVNFFLRLTVSPWKKYWKVVKMWLWNRCHKKKTLQNPSKLNNPIIGGDLLKYELKNYKKHQLHIHDIYMINPALPPYPPRILLSSSLAVMLASQINWAYRRTLRRVVPRDCRWVVISPRVCWHIRRYISTICKTSHTATNKTFHHSFK